MGTAGDKAEWPGDECLRERGKFMELVFRHQLETWLQLGGLLSVCAQPQAPFKTWPMKVQAGASPAGDALRTAYAAWLSIGRTKKAAAQAAGPGGL